MHFLVETQEQLDVLSNCDEDCYINLVTLNPLYHPALTSPCFIYYRRRDTKGFILPISHSETFNLKLDDIISFLSKHKNIYVYDKKFHKYFLPSSLNLIDIGFIRGAIDNSIFDFSVCSTNVHDNFSDQHSALNILSTIIPISKHYEKQEKTFNNVSNYLWMDKVDFYNDEFTDTFYQIEKAGLGIILHDMHKNVELSNVKHSVNGGTIYTRYNLYNTTSRPSNAFNGVNFAALTHEAKKAFIPQNDIFVEFDYSAYHPRIIAKLVGHKFKGNPYDEIPKELMFQNLYGGIRKEHLDKPFFTKVNAYIIKLWEEYNEKQYITLATGRQVHNIDNPTPNKLFNYIIQSWETYNNTLTIAKVHAYLAHKATKLALYTYDAFLFDVSKADGVKCVKDIKNILENNEYMVRAKRGTDYAFTT